MKCVCVGGGTERNKAMLSIIATRGRLYFNRLIDGRATSRVVAGEESSSVT